MYNLRVLSVAVLALLGILIRRSHCIDSIIEDTLNLEQKDTWNDTAKLKIKKIYYVKGFYLWTREYDNGSSSEKLDPMGATTISLGHFLPRKTFIIIHGFLGWGTEKWIISLKDVLLTHLPCNVISVDWPAGTTWFLPSYYSAVGKVPYVGNDTSLLLDALLQYKDLKLEDVHFIGHSLGAHVAGFASKAQGYGIGRITGLDPAGLMYHSVSAVSRLDKSDANHVDVMHTNACSRWTPFTDCYGLNENIGHSDFWPNGGEHQPACYLGSKIMGANVTGEIGCDHMLAYKYYTESLKYTKNDTYFLARPCLSRAEYFLMNCSCGDVPQYMGFNTNVDYEGVFYLSTNQYAPFAKRDPDCPCGEAANRALLFYLQVCIGIVAIIIMVICILKFTSRFVDICCFYRDRTGQDDRSILVDTPDCANSPGAKDVDPNNAQDDSLLDITVCENQGIQQEVKTLLLA